jgi:RimJ/RimL family protein N-acetyltransferase
VLPQLNTARLVLRSATSLDLTGIVALWNEPEINARLFDGRAVSESGAADLLSFLQAGTVSGLGTWTVHLRGDPRLFGTASLGRVNSASHYEPRLANHVEPTIAVSQSCPERGIGREVMSALLDYAFDDLGLELIVASIDASNERPQRMVHKFGFQRLSEVPGFAGPLLTFTLTREQRVAKSVSKSPEA